MESKRSRTVVSTTITTEPSSGEDSINNQALQGQINDLTQQISLLQRKTDELAQIVHRQEEHEQETPPKETERPSYKFPTIRAKEEGVHRRDDPNGHPTNGGGVYLGLVRAGDVVQLGVRMQKELDDGLRAIAVRMFPRGGNADRFTEERQAMVELLNKVSLRQDVVPVVGEDYFARYHDPNRGRYQRAAGARYGYMGRMPESRINAFYYETFLQLVLFRGIDLEALP
ncbi:hypothetical protein P167DRAFT_570935 [Morchella conica CCBAS932]|uniref:Uncharacterized protein n=1 Tax=Morchella conica CCBAS932 TaxID=1392247 RepID=A0A3N4L6G3_9PEZI|nr:hypothetical protein P167DRAFT_570935 [Morchella conica CCBAS932]